MPGTAWRSIGIIGVATASALVIWAAARLLGIELTVGKGPDANQVGVVDVLLTTVVAGLLAWATHRLLARSVRTLRWWPFVGSTAIAVSMLGPSYLADGAAAAALIAMHLAVGAVLVYGFARYVAQPSWTGANR